MLRILTWTQAERYHLRHDLDNINLGQARPFMTQRKVLQDRNAAGGILNVSYLAAPLLQVLNKVTPGRQSPSPSKILWDKWPLTTNHSDSSKALKCVHWWKSPKKNASDAAIPLVRTRRNCGVSEGIPHRMWHCHSCKCWDLSGLRVWNMLIKRHGCRTETDRKKPCIIYLHSSIRNWTIRQQI